MYRELKKLNLLRINIPMKKWAHKLYGNFSKEEVQMGDKYIKKCSTHSWGYTQRNAAQITPEAPAHPCLLQHYSQQRMETAKLPYY
jgi:hypothetical protein